MGSACIRACIVVVVVVVVDQAQLADRPSCTPHLLLRRFSHALQFSNPAVFSSVARTGRPQRRRAAGGLTLSHGSATADQHWQVTASTHTNTWTSSCICTSTSTEKGETGARNTVAVCLRWLWPPQRAKQHYDQLPVGCLLHFVRDASTSNRNCRMPSHIKVHVFLLLVLQSSQMVAFSTVQVDFALD